MKKYTNVAEFLAALPPDRKEQVNALRSLINKSEPTLSEHIKWNAPSFVHKGEDRITFNLHYTDRILLLLHMGATRKENKKARPILNDTTGLIAWNSDIRGTLTFTSLEDIKEKQSSLHQIISNWLAIS